MEYKNNIIEIYNWIFNIKYSNENWLYLQYERYVNLPKKITFENNNLIFWYGVKNCIKIVKENPIYEMVKNRYIDFINYKTKSYENEIERIKKQIEENNKTINLLK